MAMNPMQRKSRNSFLLGMLVMLLIAAAVIGLLMFQIVELKKQEQDEQSASVRVCVLKNDIQSGNEITVADIVYVTEEVEENGVRQNKSVLPQANRNFAPASDLATEADILEGVVSKLDLKAGTILSKDMILASDKEITNDLRLQEYNMLVLPTHLEEGEFIDIRWMLPTGQDYIVLSKKRVESIDTNTIWLEMSEIETLSMSNAIVEAYMVKGSMLYATKYVEPGMQEESSSTYTVSREVLGLINSNSNIVQEAREALWNRYNAVINERESINSAIQNEGDNAIPNVQSGISEQIQNQKALREKYLQTLDASAQNVQNAQ